MTVNDWLPLVSSIGGTAVALGGVYATLRSNKLQQQTTVSVALAQATHERQLAWEERVQRRKEEAYTSLFEWATKVLNSGRALFRARAEGSDFEAALTEFLAHRSSGASATSMILWSSTVDDHYGHVVGAVQDLTHRAHWVVNIGNGSAADASEVDPLVPDEVLDEGLTELHHAVGALLATLRKELAPILTVVTDGDENPYTTPGAMTVR